MKDAMYFSLDVNNRIDIIHYKNWKNLLIAIDNDNKYEIIVRV